MAGSVLKVGEGLKDLEIPSSTYYHWRRNFRKCGLVELKDRRPMGRRGWNQILPAERDKVFEVVLLLPEWSSREVSCYVRDSCRFTVSGALVYRIFKAGGLIREVQPKSVSDESEYRIQTIRSNQQWQTDATSLLVKNWGWHGSGIQNSWLHSFVEDVVKLR